jgi:hypothetical protein
MTSDTLSLFDVEAPRARHTDPQSSHDAAKRARPGQYDEAIFDLLVRYRALTKNQICGYLNLDSPRAWTTVASRLSQLKNAGKLEWGDYIEGDGNQWRLREQRVEVSGEVL